MATSFDANIQIGSQIGHTIPLNSKLTGYLPDVKTTLTLDGVEIPYTGEYTLNSYPLLSVSSSATTENVIAPDFIMNPYSTSTFQTLYLSNKGNAVLTITEVLTTVYPGVIEPIMNVNNNNLPITIQPGDQVLVSGAYIAYYAGEYINWFIFKSNSVNGSVKYRTHQLVLDTQNFRPTPTGFTTSTTLYGKPEIQKYTIIPIFNTIESPDTIIDVSGTISGSPAWTILSTGTNSITAKFDPDIIDNANGTYTADLTISANGATHIVTNTATVFIDHAINKNLSSWLSPVSHDNSIVGVSYDLEDDHRVMTIGVGTSSGVLVVTTTTFVPSQLYAGSFNGSTQYLSIPSTPPIHILAFTIEAWVYPDAAVGIGTIASWGGAGGAFRLFLSTDTPDIQVWNGSSLLIQQSITNPINQWTHVAVQRDDSNLVTIYINGSIVNQTTLTTDWNYVGDLIIGADLAGGSYFSGYISNFRYVRGIALYQTQASFDPPTNNLTSTQMPDINGYPSNTISGNETIVLTLQNSTVIDNSSYIRSITNNGSVATSLQTVFSSHAGPVNPNISVEDLGLGHQYSDYGNWSKVYRIPFTGDAATYYSKDYVIKTTTTSDYSSYFGEFGSIGSMFVVTDDGYGTIKVELNNLTVFNTSTITTSTYNTINNLTRAFHYYSGIDIGGRYNQILVTVDVNGSTPPNGSGWVLPENSDTMQIQPGWIMQDATGARYTVNSSGHNVLFNGWGIGFASALTIAWPLTFYASPLPLLKDPTTTYLFIGFNYNTRDKTATTATSIVKIPS